MNPMLSQPMQTYAPWARRRAGLLEPPIFTPVQEKPQEKPHNSPAHRGIMANQRAEPEASGCWAVPSSVRGRKKAGEVGDASDLSSLYPERCIYQQY